MGRRYSLMSFPLPPLSPVGQPLANVSICSTRLGANCEVMGCTVHVIRAAAHAKMYGEG